MSLVGNLEDLSLPDILQIVSLSKKSGFLMLEREGQQGKILIRQGKVIQTVSPRPGKTLGELLTSRGLLRPDDLKKALEVQRAGGGQELLGAILVRQGLIEEASLERVVQEQIEDAIVFFLTWKEGTFSFELADIQGRGEFSVDPQAFILERGIDTQWLVLEGTRLIDERAREGAARGPAEAAHEPGGETSFADLEVDAAEPVAGPPLVLVDDDPVFRALAEERFSRLGFRVVACDGAASGLAAVEQEAARGSVPALVTDIVMPTSDNQGFLGGLELVEKVRRSRPAVAVAAITAYPDENVKAKVLEGGGRFFLKPPGADPGDFFATVASSLGAPAPSAGTAAPARPPVEAAPEPEAPGPAADPTRARSGASPGAAHAPAAPPAAPPAPAAVAPAPAAAPVAAPAAAAPVRAARTVPPPKPAALDASVLGLDDGEGAAAPPPAPEEALTAHEEALLHDMLEELQSPRATSEIGLLILRFAAELLNRAVLFVVKGGKAVGLGGFGVEVASAGVGAGTGGRGVRGITIPLDEPSLLEEVVRARGPVRRPVGAARWDRALLDSLGGRTPVEAVALPLVSGGKVRVILYGDNLPEERALDGVRALEIFLERAGATLEKVLLEKRQQESAAANRASGGRHEQHVGGGIR